MWLPTINFNEENLQTVAQAFIANHDILTHKASAELEISRGSVQKMLKRLKYKPSLLQALDNDDSDVLLEFRETIILRSVADPNLLRSIV
ncbi:hypothetical protein J6590_049294 [Homalodisca vitripennis]|nr:hypothetical protein J6590_049294 [Homalodisca vitripennis]